jgi:hypothetical protein
MLASPLATQKSRGSKRKRRSGAAPRAVPSQRREQRAERTAVADRDRRAGQRMLGTVGERPASPFGGLPVSEIAILAGGVAFVVGGIPVLSGHAPGPALIVGILVVALGVIEVTGREHFSGYRSHTTLLAAIPTVGLEVLLVATAGSRTTRGALLVVIVPVFGGLFYVLRRAFIAARQRRIARR